MLFFLINSVRTIQAEARTSPLLGLPVSQYVGPISSNHIRRLRGAPGLAPKEKKNQGMFFFLIRSVRTSQAEARTSPLLGLPVSQYVDPISSNHIRRLRRAPGLGLKEKKKKDMFFLAAKQALHIANLMTAH